jgi:hypothetical protein
VLSIASLSIASAQNRPAASRQRTGNSEMNAFVGSWKLDTSRTKLGSTMISYEHAGDRLRVTSPRGTYTFKIDGTEYPTMVSGERVSWKQVDKNTIESTTKRNGKVEVVTTRVFSTDAKTISVTTNISGDRLSTFRSRMERQAGTSSGNPLIGTWKQTRESSSGESATLAYTAVPGGLKVRYDGPMADEYTLIFDGKEHPGGTGTPNTNVTARKINDRSLEERWTRDGKVFSTSTITISTDGQELTEQQQPGNPQGEPSMFVYRRTK